MTITLPDEMRTTLERKASAAGFATVDEFIADALTDDDEAGSTRPPDFRTREEFDRLIEEGFASGPPIPVDKAFWARLDTRIRDRAATREGPQ